MSEELKKVCQATGWSEDFAQGALEKAKALGIGKKKYVRNACWTMSEAELTAFAEKEREKKEKREEKIQEVMALTGWDYDTAKTGLKEAKARGISGFQYILKAAWQLTAEEQEELGRELEKARAHRSENYKFYVDAVCKKSGWSSEQATAKMEAAQELGISYLKYAQKAAWTLDDGALRELAEDVTEYKEETMKENKALYLEKIMEQTGWSRGKTELEVLKAKNISGCSYEDFYVFRFWQLTPEEQTKYVTLDLFNKMRIKYNDYGTAARIFDDKAEFNRTFSEFIDRRWFVNKDLSYEDFLARIEGLDTIFVKPLALTQGKGIEKFPCNVSEEENRKLYGMLMDMEPAIIEQYITQHEKMMELCPSSVNTVRVTTLNIDGECHYLYSVLRMGSGSVVDNFHAGGIAASVNIETGIVYTDAVNLNGDVYLVHPTSGIEVMGFQIPHWDQILYKSCIASYKVPDVKLVGWDFAVTPDGVDLIEGNPGASYVVAQIPNVPIRFGLREIMTNPFL